jgi:hypothetical protein
MSHNQATLGISQERNSFDFFEFHREQVLKCVSDLRQGNVNSMILQK